ncbi:histidine triad nucleotide-binding protein [Patescibacteria group bacterium]
MRNCIFCKIIKKEIPAKIVYEDKDVIAFEDIKPVVPVHILIIPKKHVVAAKLKAKDGNVIGKIFLLAQEITRKKKVSKKGYRLVMNIGKNAGQTVDHLHIHLLAGKKLPWA